MKTTLGDKVIAYLTLMSGLSISGVAVYYSVAGLVSIFAASAVPIIVMGVALEVSKLIATVWLKMNWSRAPFLIKTYLFTAITVLMIITSMGIFGYLSKAHLDQAVPTGDIAAKVELLDTKIQTQKDNIASSKAALKQMDAQVNEMLSRSTDNKGTERAVQIRKQQEKERVKLQKDIETGNVAIAKLNEERAPIAKDLRKVEAEVGPIKYIAALIYGDNPDSNILEKAVRWVIITIVAVFDPLAVILLLASQYSFAWFRQDREAMEGDSPKGPEPTVTPDEPVVPPPVVIIEEEKPIIDEPIKAVIEEPVKTVANFEASLTATPELDHIDIPNTKVVVETLWVEPISENRDDTTVESSPQQTNTTSEETEIAKWNKMIAEAEAAADAERELSLQAKADYIDDDEATKEAIKWAEEQRQKADQESKKNSSITWMERQGPEQIKRTLE